MTQHTNRSEEMPFVTRALYGSAAVLALLVGAEAVTEAVRRAAGSLGQIAAALVPDAAMGGLLVAMVGAGWLVKHLSHRERAMAAA